MEATNNSYIDAFFDVARCYHKGIGVEKDTDTAMHYYILYAGASHSSKAQYVQYRLGKMFAEGINTSSDPSRAAFFLRLACKSTNIPQFRCYLVKFLLSQPQNFKTDRELFSICEDDADKCKSWAINDLGICFARGISVPRDYQKAANLFLKAAQSGIHEAMFNLGVLIKENGDPSAQSESTQWLEQSGITGESFEKFLPSDPEVHYKD